MIDEQKILGMLQAKALGCLDADEDKDLHDFIDAGHLFPWDVLGVYQSTASLLPLTLKREMPNLELKDKIALKLIKLRDEQRIQKSIEEEKKELGQPEELIEDEGEIDGQGDYSIQDSTYEPMIETEPEVTEINDELDLSLNADEASFNVDEIVLTGFKPADISESKTGFDVLEKAPDDTLIENLIEDKNIEALNVEEVKDENVWDEPEKPQTSLVEEPVIKQIAETNQIEDGDKHPDFTKKPIAEKMYRAIEQDFDSLKYHYEESDKRLTRGLLFSYIIIAVLFALLIFSYFKFSADIKVLENEIRDLKKNSSSLINEQIVITDQHFFS